MGITNFIWANKKARKKIIRLGKKAIKIPLTPLYAKTIGIGSIIILTPCVIALCSLGFTLSILNGQAIYIAMAKVMLVFLSSAGFLYCNYKLYYPTK